MFWPTLRIRRVKGSLVMLFLVSVIVISQIQ